MSQTLRYSAGKAAAEAFAIPVDCTAWLEGETIASVVYSATKLSDGSDASATVLDAAKHAHTAAGVVKPWVKAGTAGEEYEVKLVITGSSASVLIVYIHVPVTRA